MLRCLREKKHAAWCAVKVLDFALTDNDTNCQRCAMTYLRRVLIVNCGIE